MNALSDFYQSQARANRSTIPWLASLQEKALNEFQRLGFPSRQDEDWKYTALDSFLQQGFACPDRQSVPVSLAEDIPVSKGQHVLIDKGQTLVPQCLLKDLPAGVLVVPLSEALHSHGQLIQSCLDKMPKEQAFLALNLASLHAGVFIHIPEGTCIEQTIVIRHWQNHPGQAAYVRHLIVAEKGSRASILESFEGEEACSYFTNVITQAFLRSGSSLVHYKIQREGQKAFHMGHLVVEQEEASQFASHSLSLGGRLVRSDSSFRLMEPKAGCLLNGIYIPKDNQHMDHHTRVDHLVPDCRSDQDYKGVLAGHSRAVFNGKVIVAKNAQHTEAHQQNKNLLLSTRAEIDTKPQLEIFADDVICSHGATVGQLDTEALFYLATRGIDPGEASQYLIQAFAADNLRLIPDPDLAAWMADQITRAVGVNHENF